MVNWIETMKYVSDGVLCTGCFRGLDFDVIARDGVIHVNLEV